VITGDETWAYKYGVKIKQQCSQWKSKSSPRPKQHGTADQKTVLNIFFNSQSLVNSGFIAVCQTELGYIQFLKRPIDAQGGRSENIVTIIMCWNQSTVTELT
jgi:hypothetical protein